jgi:hypothetical protein
MSWQDMWLAASVPPERETYKPRLNDSFLLAFAL